MALAVDKALLLVGMLSAVDQTVEEKVCSQCYKESGLYAICTREIVKGVQK